MCAARSPGVDGGAGRVLRTALGADAGERRVVKSSRRRRQDRAKRRTSAAVREAAAARRRLRNEALTEVERRLELLHDPATPVDVVASVIGEVYAGEPVMPGLATLLAERRGSVGEVVKVAETLAAGQHA